MTEWKPEAGKDAVVRVVGPSPNLEGFWNIVMPHSPSGVFTVHHSALRPLPTALSAEDAAVLKVLHEHALAWTAWRSAAPGVDAYEKSRVADDTGHKLMAVMDALIERRRSTPPAAVALPTTPDTTALRDAVVEAAKEQEAAAGSPACGSGDGCEAYQSACMATTRAVRALLAAEKPADPVVEALDDLKLLADQWEARGDRHSADRLRAALSALGDRGRG